MDTLKVLIGSRQAPDIEAMLSEVPSGVEVRFLPHGEPLRDHIADVEILFGHIGEDAMQAATALRWAHQPHAGVEGFMYPNTAQVPRNISGGVPCNSSLITYTVMWRVNC